MTTISTTAPVSPAYNTSATSGTASAFSKTSDAGLSRQAVALASDASVVAILGGGTTSPTYNAAGLLATIVQAGTAPSSTTTATSAPSTATPAGSTSADGSTTDSSTATDSQSSLNQSVVNNLSQSSSPSDVYTAAGSVPSVDVNSNFAALLKTNPSIASTVIRDSFAQGIVSTISTSA